MEGEYFDPARPGSLGGKETFFKHHSEWKKTKREKEGADDDPFSAWEAYTVHRPISTRKFPRNKTRAYTLDEQWQADLCDVTRLASKNKGVKFLLTVVDVFSRYAWVRPVKSKQGAIIADALRDIFETGGRTPTLLQTDQGKEFLNKDVRALLEEYDAELFFTHSPDIKAALVERFNRTFKNRLYRYMTKSGTETYLPVLQDLVNSYNETVHSSIGRTPASVTAENVKEVFQFQYADQLKDSVSKRRRDHPPQFKVGDTVRISKNKAAFDKGYLPNWSEEVFRVDRIVFRRPVIYRLRDLNGEEIKGIFYGPELQRVTGYDEEVLKADVVRHKTNKKTGEKEVLIHYRGHPKDSLKWISEKDLEEVEEKKE
jgi:transposase InsO family protein